LKLWETPQDFQFLGNGIFSCVNFQISLTLCLSIKNRNSENKPRKQHWKYKINNLKARIYHIKTMNDDTEFVKSLKHLKILREDKTQFPYLVNSSGRYYILPHGVRYKVAVQNPFTTIKCSCKITIDGEEMGGWVLPADCSFSFERPANHAECFTFLRIGLVEKVETLNKKGYLTALEKKHNRDVLRLTPLGSGITSGRPKNGLVVVEFSPEDIELLVRTPNGKIISFPYDPKKKVCDIIRMIYDDDESLRSVPLLSFNGLQLQNHHTLQEYGISKGSTIEMGFCTGKSFHLFVKTVTGKTITINNCFPNELVYGLMRKIADKEGIPVDQQRLIYRGLLDNPYRSLDDCGVKPEVTIDLGLRLRGGGVMPPGDVPISVGPLGYSASKKAVSEVSPPHLAAGATTLHGKSSQEFGETKGVFRSDDSKAVSFSVRLVANADEDLSRSTVVMDTSIKPTSLKNLKRKRDPSPVRER
jgi:large subunit ribosomal protein L40e